MLKVIVRRRREFESVRVVDNAVKVYADVFCYQGVVNGFDVRHTHAGGADNAVGLLLYSP